MGRMLKAPTDTFDSDPHYPKTLICKFCVQVDSNRARIGIRSWYNHVRTKKHVEAVDGLRTWRIDQESHENNLVPEVPEPYAEVVDLVDADVEEGRIGPEPMDIDPVQNPVQEALEFGSESSDNESEILSYIGEENEDDFQDSGFISSDEEHDEITPKAYPQQTGPYYPYDSKVMAYLDMLDNLPRQRISDSVMQFVIAILRNCGVQNVPSFNKFRKVQREMAERHGIRQHQFHNPDGDDLYINDPRDLIMADWSNPSVRKHMRLYPEHSTTGKPPVLSEVWHGSRWQDLPAECLPPMVEHPETLQHFYVGELCLTKSGEWIIPEQWVTETKTGKLLAKARVAEKDEQVNVSTLY